uniref:(northern house mosquito) hypothetical protein n=1 Tax=Culex pipiens TaxID=7175 RepID=A0A8D8P5C0_CULPI
MTLRKTVRTNRPRSLPSQMRLRKIAKSPLPQPPGSRRKRSVKRRRNARNVKRRKRKLRLRPPPRQHLQQQPPKHVTKTTKNESVLSVANRKPSKTRSNLPRRRKSPSSRKR